MSSGYDPVGGSTSNVEGLVVVLDDQLVQLQLQRQDT